MRATPRSRTQAWAASTSRRATPHRRPLDVEEEDLGVGVPAQGPQQLAQLALGHRPPAHPEERIEGGVVVRDQAPERRDPIDLLGARRAYAPRARFPARLLPAHPMASPARPVVARTRPVPRA